MKNHQDNSITLPALLRTADRVNTLETNSLCCAAAGIIAPTSATAEALIPHEKLRGAALANATLNAQERPLAQLVLGYIALLDTHSNCGRDTCPSGDSQIFFLNHGVENLSRFCTLPEQLNLVIVGTKRPQLFHRTNRFRQRFLQTENGRNDIIRKRLYQRVPKYPATLLQSGRTVPISRQGIPSIDGTTIQGTNCFIRSTLSQVSGTRLSLLCSPTRTVYLPFMLIISNHKRSNDSRYRTDRLYPGSSVLHRIKSPQNDKQSAPKRTDNEEQPNHPDAGDLHSSRSLKLHRRSWPLSIKNLFSLPFSMIDVHGDQA